LRIPSLRRHALSSYSEAMTDFPPLNALFFAGLGIATFLGASAIAIKLLPFDLWKQVVEERNTAAAIVAGAVALGLCWIIAAAMH
jgi:putative membrane protein